MLIIYKKKDTTFYIDVEFTRNVDLLSEVNCRYIRNTASTIAKS